ncbi:DUF2357 domain-containing protein [Halobacillus fulvus]|nr:DUF2357 domain-containing protein [Halobacillus fulvus]
MALLNSGDSRLELKEAELGWIPFSKAYLTEATEYQLRFKGEHPDIRMQDVPMPFYKRDSFHYATFLTPFQAGTLNVQVNGEQHDAFVYPDSRKLTAEQFDLMVEEILQEANICFQLSGLETGVDSSGRSRDVSWTQWAYIDRSFHQLRQVFTKISAQPFRRLEKQPLMMKRDKVRRVSHSTMTWLDRKGYGTDIPPHVYTEKTFETTDVYENRIVKKQAIDLLMLLGRYETVERVEIARQAKAYRSVLKRWLNGAFLDGISSHRGSYTVTQKFRKHPVYRLWYQWFDRLYKHAQEGVGFEYPIALKDTFELYEMWCFMKIIRYLRELGYLKNPAQIFRITKEGLFLNLAENKESRIDLRGGMTLYFQRVYQANTKEFHTYTQRMIPDIVLEGEDSIIVFDPKYRVPGNLGTALGEMHKYRDGILHRETGKRAVKEVYILTPTLEEDAAVMRYFEESFHKKYGMGAVQMVAGAHNDSIRKTLAECLKLLSV